MWTCPKCGFEFVRTNQGHYCGKAPENVDQYIEQQAPEVRTHLKALRRIILSNVSEVEEKIVWSMPTYQKGKNSISFYAGKKNVSLYVDIDIIEIYAHQLEEYKINKNTIYLSYHKELPESLIADLVKKSLEKDIG